MENELGYYKNIFQHELTPMIQLLEFKRTVLSVNDWIKFVESTKLSIINNPEQYLGKELPDSRMVLQSIEEIFDELNVIA